MPGFKLSRLFFDSAAVIAALDPQTRALLSKLGAFIRQRARSSIRNRDGKRTATVRGKKVSVRKKVTSRPGDPPNSHGRGLLRRFLFFAFDPATRSVVIGPERLPKPGLAPETLEHGGTAEIDSWAGHGRRKRKRIQLAARPFMGPAMSAELKNTNSVWRQVASSRP